MPLLFELIVSLLIVYGATLAFSLALAERWRRHALSRKRDERRKVRAARKDVNDG